jgi:hypothetical protein
MWLTLGNHAMKQTISDHKLEGWSGLVELTESEGNHPHCADETRTVYLLAK